MRVEANDASNYIPNQHAPKTYTAQAHDSVTSVAQAYQVTPEELARANGISVTTELQPNQVLMLPLNAVQPSTNDPASTPQTPAQKTDAAIAAYDAAVKAHGDLMSSLPHNARGRDGTSDTVIASNATVAQAKAAMNQAIADEISGQVASRNNGVPPEFRTPTDQSITEFGQNILQRHQGDATAQSDISDSIQTYQVTAKANALIPDFSGNWSAADKLKRIILQGQPPEVVNAVLADPRVQSWINQAAQDIDQPYNGSKPEDLNSDIDQATQAAQNLQSATDGLPPELATAVTQASQPTIQKITQLQWGSQGSQVPFDTVQGVLSSLGNNSQAQSVIDQVAGYYVHNLGMVSRLTDGSPRSVLANTISDYGNGNPAFAIALARQLQTTHPAQAKAVLSAAEDGVEQFQDHLSQDTANYRYMTKELNWLTQNTQSAMSPAQMENAIANYAKGKGPDWQQQFEAMQNKIVADTRALADGVAQLKGLPDDLKGLVPDMDQRIDKNISDNESTQKAFQFAATKDPGIFEGEEGEKLANVMVELGHKNKELTEAIAKAYVAGHFLPAIKDLDPKDPASYAKTQHALDELRGKALMFGISQSQMDDQVHELRKLVTDLNNPKPQGEGEGKSPEQTEIDFDKTKENLVEMGKEPLSGGITGTAFRTMAFGLSGFALINSANKTSQNPQLKDELNTLALSINTGQDAIDFAKTVKLISPEGDAAQWGATGARGILAGRFANALYGTYFAADLADSWGNVPKMALDSTGIAGSVMSIAGSYGSYAEAGSLIGPIGAGLVVLATTGLFLVETGQANAEHTKAAAEFMVGGGVKEDVAKALSGDAMGAGSTVQSGLNMSDVDLQNLAEARPEIFKMPPITTQAFVDLAQACGIQGGNALGFANALAQDDPNYMDHFSNLHTADSSTHPLTYKANLVENVIQTYPHAKALLQPDVVNADGAMRRQADRDFESAASLSERDQYFGNYLKGQSNTAYQTEFISDMKQQGILGTWVHGIRQDAINGWPQAAKNAIQIAENANVLTADEANRYLAELR